MMEPLTYAVSAETRRSIILYGVCGFSACFIAVVSALTYRAIQPDKRIVYVKVPWEEIYKACQGDWTVNEEKGQQDGRLIRTERIRLCGQIATDAVSKGLAN